MKWKELCEQTVAAAQMAAHFIGEERKKFDQADVKEKGQRNLVSYVDVTAEKIIVEHLKPLIPGAGFITEEKTILETNAPYQWIIDPLDGTTNFIHGIPVYAVSIALQYENELVAGTVHEVNLNESFYAWKGGGAYLNGSPIKVTETNVLANALCATGFPYDHFPNLDRYFSTLKYLFQHTHGIRRFGSAAVDMAYVACGRLDAFYEYNLNAWDIAAGALIVQEAGGVVTDFSGGSNFLFGKEIVAANKGVFSEFLEAVVHPKE